MSAQNLEDEDEGTTGPGGTGEDSGEDAAPAATDDSDDEAEAPTDAKSDEGEDDAPAEPSSPVLAAPVDPEAAKAQQIRDYIAKQYGDVSSDAGIHAAKAKAARTNQVSNIGEALEGLARSNSMAHGGAGVDQGFYQGLRAQGQQGVQQAQAQREQAIKDFVTKQQLGRQGVQDAQQAKDFAFQNEQRDPSSKTSQAVRDTYAKMFPKVVDQLGDSFGSLSAADIKENLTAPLDLKAKADANVEAAKQRTIAAATLAETRRQFDLTKNQGQAATEMTNRINGGRGTPPSIQASMASQQAIAKAQALLAQYPDPNNMPQQMVALLNSEIEKVAAGGGGTEAGRQGLDPGTFSEKWQAFKAKAGDSPTGADLGAFIKNNASYLSDLKNVVDGTVSKYQRQTFDDYHNAGRLAPDFEERYKAQRPELFPEEQAVSAAGSSAAGSSAPQEGSGTANAAPALKPGHQEGGYEFLGGDPGDKRNWKKVGG